MAKFTYNDIVRTKRGADEKLRPGENAWVIAIIEDRDSFPLKQFPPGIIYSVEFDDGAAMDCHEDDLELVKKNSAG